MKWSDPQPAVRNRILAVAMPRLFCAATLALLLTTFQTACQKHRVVTLPAARPTSVPVPDPGPTTIPAASSAPATSGPSSPNAPTNPVTTPPVSAPAAPATNPAPVETPAAPSRRPARTPAAVPAQTPPPASTQPAPQLGPILTDLQQRQYNAAVDQSIARAQASLSSIGKRPLNRQQQSDFEQIQGFIQQAQAVRASDLPAAKRLAEKAEVLARNLAKNVQ